MASINNLTTLYANEIYKIFSTGTTEISDQYAIKTEVENANSANTSNIATNIADIAVLNTKQLQNFQNISSITHLLNTDYQTNTTLTTNFYNKAEIDTTFNNYYTSTQIDTNLSTNYQNNILLATNFYNKGEVDTLIAGAGGGGGYTDTEIDNLLDSRVPVSDFTNRFKTNPIIDCSAPTVIHSGLTLNNETINISPNTGLLFSNQFGGGDKIVSVFKNATNYITLQGNKIISNATSDDSVVDLELNPSGNVNITNDLSLTNLTADGINLTNNINIGGNIELTDSNTSIERYNNATKSNTSMDIRTNQEATRLILGGASDNDTNTYLECNNTTGGTTLFKPTYFKDTINYENETSNISNNSGLTVYKNTTDASNVFTIKNAQGYIKFNSFNINAYNTSNDSSSLLLLNTANGNGVYCLSLGIGVIAGGNKLNVAGSSNFGGTSSFQNISTFNSDIYINNSGRIFQRADANNSLNVISTNEINFSLQSNRTTDPTTGTIALQINDTNGITINRAVTNNQTFNSIGNIVGEADIISWGRFMFQNSSELKEVLDGQYKLFVRNSDALGDINLTVGLEASTPEIKLTDANVNLLGHLDITHSTVSTSERVKIDNPDADGLIFLSINGANICEVSSTGLYVNGVLDSSSDIKLKENVKEIDNKVFVEMVKYIKPKEFNYIGNNKKQIGFIANDVLNSKMPKQWQNLVHEGSEGYLRMNYSKMVAPLWGCVQSLINEVEELKKEVKKLKKDNKDSDSDGRRSPPSGRSRDKSPKAKAKAKSKSKN